MLYRRFFIPLVFIASFFLFSVSVGAQTPAEQAVKEPIELNYWRVFDGEDAFDEIITTYQRLYPNVRINYKKIRYETYESELINALAEDRGPDILSIHNTWIGKYETKLLPMPPAVYIPQTILEKSFGCSKKQQKAVIQTIPTPNLDTLKKQFVDVVSNDVVRENAVYALPLSVDTLALIYNQNILDQMGVAEPPQSWTEVTESSIRLTQQNSEGNITRSGIALGGYGNINRSFDILSLLMMQNGTIMTPPDSSQATFGQRPVYITDPEYHPGREALRFYTDFANPTKEVYTWNEGLPESLDAFIQGKVAMILGYSYDIPTIRSRGPKINFRISPVPHITNARLDATGKEINFANYWVEGVSRKTRYPDHAWNFILFMTEPGNAIHYLEKTKKPASLRALVSQQLNDPDLAVFASQTLSAQSWYRGKRPDLAEEYFNTMIREVLLGEQTVNRSIAVGEERMNQTY